MHKLSIYTDYLEPIEDNAPTLLPWDSTKRNLTFDLLNDLTRNFTDAGEDVLSQYSIILEDVFPMTWMQSSILSFLNVHGAHTNSIAHSVITTDWDAYLTKGSVRGLLGQLLVEMVPEDNQKSFRNSVLQNGNFDLLVFGLELHLEAASLGKIVDGNIGDIITTSGIPWDLNPNDLSYETYEEVLAKFPYTDDNIIRLLRTKRTFNRLIRKSTTSSKAGMYKLLRITTRVVLFLQVPVTMKFSYNEIFLQ